MRAMVLDAPNQLLQLRDVPKPKQQDVGQVLIRVAACAVCRTDLHIVDGELSSPAPALVPGHQIVGVVAETGTGADQFAIGDRVGVPWLGWADGTCGFCGSGRENLCDRAR